MNLDEKSITEIALAFLYLGEGAKNCDTAIGNSNPLVLKFFIACLNYLYGVKPYQLKCSIHIRSDQNGHKLNKYWSKTLKIPIKNFGACLIDKRTVKSKTYPTYKGVCVVRAGRIAIQRKLIFLSNKFCDKIVSRTHSSVVERLFDVKKVVGSIPTASTQTI